jgi:hypothetical protein
MESQLCNRPADGSETAARATDYAAGAGSVPPHVGHASRAAQPSGCEILRPDHQPELFQCWVDPLHPRRVRMAKLGQDSRDYERFDVVHGGVIPRKAGEPRGEQWR